MPRLDDEIAAAELKLQPVNTQQRELEARTPSPAASTPRCQVTAPPPDKSAVESGHYSWSAAMPASRGRTSTRYCPAGPSPAALAWVGSVMAPFGEPRLERPPCRFVRLGRNLCV